MKRNLRELVHDGFMAAAPKALLRKMSRCDQIVQRVSFPETQTVAQKLETVFHIAICQACWSYQKQLSRMAYAYRKLCDERCKLVSKRSIEIRILELTREFSKK